MPYHQGDHIVMEPSTDLILHIEALIFASDRPLSQMDILSLLANTLNITVNGNEVSECINLLAKKYATGEFSFELKESGGGFQFLTKKKYHPSILHLNGDKYIKKLSAAAMETLSIVAYKQPVTKMDIELIRGVSADYSIQKLLEKELIYISGRKEDAIGKPLLYCTTNGFMDYLGINSPAQLPQINEIISTVTISPGEGKEAKPLERQLQLESN